MYLSISTLANVKRTLCLSDLVSFKSAAALNVKGGVELAPFDDVKRTVSSLVFRSWIWIWSSSLLTVRHHRRSDDSLLPELFSLCLFVCWAH